MFARQSKHFLKLKVWIFESIIYLTPPTIDSLAADCQARAMNFEYFRYDTVCDLSIISKLICANPSLTSLNLRGNDFDTNATIGLVREAKSKSLASLNLAKNALG